MASREARVQYTSYEQGLVEKLWAYRGSNFEEFSDLFDPHQYPSPPVFRREHAHNNVLVRPNASSAECARVRAAIPDGKRHRWFWSMKSSQAVAQSVFANLKECGKLGLLTEIVDDDGKPPFPWSGSPDCEAQLEHHVDYLGESRPTSIDVLLDSGRYRVAVECKLTEFDLGPCSQPKDGYCSGKYGTTPSQSARCALSAKGVAYWQHIPALFQWRNDEDFDPCPIYAPYQLVRNVLAACVRPGAVVSERAGHAVLLYDQRNPHCASGGDIYKAYESVRGALKDRSLIRLCTWQQVIRVIENDKDTAWLAKELRAKYGF